MRGMTDRRRLDEFMELLGRETRGPGTVYLTGGASAVLEGWRESTIDVDLHFDPEPGGAFEALRDAKESLQLNVELAAAHHFIPELPGWKDRSIFIARRGSIDFFHYDFNAQALSKIERGHEKDLADVTSMLSFGHVRPVELREHFEAISSGLLRYPALDEAVFRRKLEQFLESHALGEKDW